VTNLVEHNCEPYRCHRTEYGIKKIQDNRVLRCPPCVTEVGEEEFKVFQSHPRTSEDSVLKIVILKYDDQSRHGDVGKHQCKCDSGKCQQP